MRTMKFCMLCVPMLLGAGCMRYEEHVRFNRDGSGTVEAHLVVPRTTLDRLAARTDDGETPDVFTPEMTTDEIARRIAREGITIRRIEVEDTDTARIWHVEYAFRDIVAFHAARNAGRGSSLSKWADTYQLALLVSGGADEAGYGGTIDAADSAAVAALFGGFSARYTVEMPTRIIAAPGGTTDGVTATFTWSFARDGFAAIEPRSLHVIFRAERLRWPTFEAIPGSVESREDHEM